MRVLAAEAQSTQREKLHEVKLHGKFGLGPMVVDAQTGFRMTRRTIAAYATSQLAAPIQRKSFVLSAVFPPRLSAPLRLAQRCSFTPIL